MFVGKGGADYLEPDSGIHEGGFVEDDAREGAAAEGHCVFGALQFDDRSIHKFEFEIGLVFAFDPRGGDELFKDFPGNVLRHPVGGGAVEEGFAGAGNRSTQEFDAGEVGLAEAAACNEDAEAVFIFEYFPLGATQS